MSAHSSPVVNVLDLEVAGGVVDERLPRAERSVIALVAGAVGAGWTLSMTRSGAMTSTRRVASRSWNARLKRSMTSSVACVMSVGFIIAVSFLVGVGSDLAPLPSTRCPRKPVKAGRRSVSRDHRPGRIGCGRSAIRIRDGLIIGRDARDRAMNRLAAGSLGQRHQSRQRLQTRSWSTPSAIAPV